MILSFNIQSISDNGKGIIDNLGAANTAAIRKDALISKAEAYKKYNGAAIVEMLVKIMPDMARSIAEPVGNIKDMRVYGENGADSVGGMTPALMKQTFDMMSDATGVDFKEILRSNTYDAKVNRNVTLDAKPVQVDIKNAEKTSEAEEENLISES